MNWDNWENHAAWLSTQVTEPGSRWRPLIAAVPRHEFVPRWWSRKEDGWTLEDGPAKPAADWLGGVYRDTSLITQVDTLHADHASEHDRPQGRPTSSSTMPGLVVSMYRHAMIDDDTDILDIGTGTGYGAALLATRLGDARVTTIDIDPYLVKTGLIITGRYPVVNTSFAWELFSMLGVTVPGIEHHYESGPDGTRTAWLAHPDGSFARATANGDELPEVRQDGPQRLWDTADQIRHTWLTDGNLPAYGAAVTITPDGAIHLKKGRWETTIPASP